jgi:hydrogenase nickel incorporation protein HypA/HybF
MHEIGLLQNVIGAALKNAVQHGAQRVERITMRIGADSGVDPEVITFAFPMVTRGTIAEGAELALEPVPTRCRCPQCEIEFEPADELYVCPRCERPGAHAVAGREFWLAAIDIN